MKRLLPATACRVFAAFSLLFLSTWATGCRTMPSEPPIEVSLVNLRFGQSTLFETALTAVVRLENGQPEDVEVTGASFRLDLNGDRVGRGLSDATLAVPRLSTATTEVQVHLRNLTMVNFLRELQHKGAVEYRLQGTVYMTVAGARRARSVPVARAGRLELRDLGAPQNVPSR